MPRVLGFLISLTLLGISLFAWSTQVPGFGYDEAWLGLIAHRIIVEPDFWPTVTLSNYATAWNQYLLALGFKVFGTSIAVYRAVGKVEFLLGISLISGALALAGETLAAAVFPGLIAFFPAVIFNQRWIVELTTFAIFCTGLTVLGLAKRWKQGPGWISAWLIFTGVVLGVTTHVIVFAPLFALWYCLFVSGKLENRKDRTLISSIFATLILFFIYIYRTEDRHLATSAAILVSLISVGITWISFPTKFRLKALLIPSVPGTLLLVPFFVYLEGHWLVKQFNGFIENPLWIGSLFIPIGGLVWSLRRYFTEGPGRRTWMLPLYSYFTLTLLGIYSMATKVGARFLEIPFLFLAGMMTLGFVRIRKQQQIGLALLWIALGTGEIWQNYLKPSIEERQLSVTYTLGKLMRDSSQDFASKWKVVRKLSEEGCRLEDLLPESQWYELKFMSLGDWPPLQRNSCRLGHAIDLNSVIF